jgi:hypothetical protein
MMSRNNPRWGAPRIHSELLKLGIEITEPTVAKYMVRHRKPPGLVPVFVWSRTRLILPETDHLQDFFLLFAHPNTHPFSAATAALGALCRTE